MDRSFAGMMSGAILTPDGAEFATRSRRVYSMRQYLDLMEHTLATAWKSRDRTGTGTVSVFGIRCALISARAFRWSPPRSCHVSRSFTSCSGSWPATPTSISHDNGVRIWDEWADERGDLVGYGRHGDHGRRRTAGPSIRCQPS